MKSTEPCNKTAPTLIFTYGNPSRGDDGLGPAMFERLEADKPDSHYLDDVELLTDYQLQIEHAIDIQQRKHVLFVDASVSAKAPFEFYRLQPERDDSYTTHAMSPVAVLDVYRQINQCEPPPSYMLSIRGYQFSLGQEMSDQAKLNLRQAHDFIKHLLNSGFEPASNIRANDVKEQ